MGRRKSWSVCSTKNLKLVKSLGAGKVLDYREGNFTDSGETYDIIFVAVNKIPSSQRKTALKKKVVYLNVKNIQAQI